MVEGDYVFKEAIQFLNNLLPLKELQWDEYLCRSAQMHIDDIGPKGLLLYQSSDGTEPEDRISKYGNYIGTLGENIDFGPNDALGVIISLTLDDGEEERPHRKNLFNQDYQKIGIACGSHKTEFKMCVMDFAYDFIPLTSVIKEQNDKFKKIEEELNNEINKLKEELYKSKKIIETQKKEIEQLKKNYNSSNKGFNDKLKDLNKLQRLIVQKDFEINELKQKLLENKNIINIDERNKEKKIDKCVCFISSDHEITYAIPCSGESTFAEVEEKLYQEYSKYRETNNTFLANGKNILRFKTINDNNIGNGKPVLLIAPS